MKEAEVTYDPQSIDAEIQDIMTMTLTSALEGYRQETVLCGIDAYDLWCHEKNVADIMRFDKATVEIVSTLPRYAIVVVFSNGQATKSISTNVEMYA